MRCSGHWPRSICVHYRYRDSRCMLQCSFECLKQTGTMAWLNVSSTQRMCLRVGISFSLFPGDNDKALLFYNQ